MSETALSRRPRRARSLRRSIALALLGSSGVALALAGGQACGPGSLDDLTRGRVDAGTMADVEAAAPDAPICIHASAPERPNVEDSPNGLNLTFAIDDLRFDTGTEPRALPAPLGLDLDKTCTCPEPVSCTPRSDAAAEACDLDGGRDNAAGQLLYNLLTVTTKADGGPLLVVREQISRGFFTALFQVQGWNGKPDDPHVIVTVVLSSGSADDADGGRILPKFDGNDVWKVEPTSLAGGDNLVGRDCRNVPCVALSIDPNAYVVGGVVVSHIDSAPIRIRTESGPLVIDFIDSTLIARISQGPGGAYRLDGELTGRWPTDRLLSGLAGVRDPTTNKSLCPPGNSIAYDLVKRAVCESADLAIDPARDRTSAACSALSDAVSFTAIPATLGKVEASLQEPSDCPGFTDSCDRQ